LQNLNTFEVYGDNYRTVDGTAERDYVHVEDVVDANIEAVKYLDDGKPSEIINLGCGVGYTVLEVIQTVKIVTGHRVQYVLKPPREGDPDILVADISKAKILLNYKPKHDITSIIKSAYEWEKKRRRYN
jgi:UDP-glucose 4-epimerase